MEEAVRDRQFREKERAMAEGREVLTPQAARSLFGISGPAVRQARIEGHVRTPVTLEVTGSPVHLLGLSSAVEYWGHRKRQDFDAVLMDMRENSCLLGVGWTFFNVLHTRPLVRLDVCV